MDKEACDGWCGPHKTIELAVDDCIDQYLPDPKFPIYVASGRKMTKAEWGDMEDVDFSWEVDTREIFQISLIREFYETKTKTPC